MESGNISDLQISASSVFQGILVAHLARLRHGRCWATGVLDSRQWLQVDLGNTMRVTGIATQGRPVNSQWVKQYKLEYGEDGQTFAFYRHNGESSVTV